MSKQFSLITHHRDQKTGKISKVTPYRMFYTQLHGEIYERPPGSGLCYFPDGSRAPTIEQVRKINEDRKAKEPKPLTTADISALKAEWEEKLRHELEISIKAKAEAELQSKVSDMVAERVGQVMQKMNVETEKAKAISQIAVKNATQDVSKSSVAPVSKPGILPVQKSETKVEAVVGGEK